MSSSPEVPPTADLVRLIGEAIVHAPRKRATWRDLLATRLYGRLNAAAAAQNVLVELHVNGYEVVPPNDSLQADA